MVTEHLIFAQKNRVCCWKGLVRNPWYRKSGRLYDQIDKMERLQFSDFCQKGHFMAFRFFMSSKLVQWSTLCEVHYMIIDRIRKNKMYRITMRDRSVACLVRKKVLQCAPQFLISEGGNSHNFSFSCAVCKLHLLWTTAFTVFFFFSLHFPLKRLATLWSLRLFNFSLSFAISAAFLLSRSGTSPKSKSGVGLTQFINTRRITRCSSRRRMWPSQFHRLSLARIMTSRVSSRASSR